MSRWRSPRVLSRCHSAGIVHGNIKPSNIFITTSGKIRLVDAGLGARHTKSELLSGSESEPSIRYLAPDQILHGEIGVRTDLYQLGAVLYELGYNRAVFSGNDRKTLIDQILNENPPCDSFMDLSGDWVLTIEKLLAKSPRTGSRTLSSFV